MMKLDAILSYLLSILEGGLAGACFYHAGQEKEKKYKIILYIASAAWFISSVLDGIEGTRALRRSKEAADAEPDWEPYQ